MDLYTLQGLIKFKRLLKSPSAEIISSFFNSYDFEDFEGEILFNHIKTYNCNYDRCNICKEINHFECLKSCNKCLKVICYNCEYFGEFCSNCSPKCKYCSNVNDIIKCYGCEDYFCNEYSYCSSSMVIIFHTGDKKYYFCNKKCIPIEFLRNRVILELNRKFKRRALLKNLKMYNLKLRSDSKLCQKYINGTLEEPMTTEKVCQKMCEMKYLFDYCSMRFYLDQVYNDNYRNPENNFEIAKQEALKNNGNVYPIVWPWKTKVEETHRENMKKVLQELDLIPPKINCKREKIFPGTETYHITLKKFKDDYPMMFSEREHEEIDRNNMKRVLEELLS
jgi:hypothetical protein